VNADNIVLVSKIRRTQTEPVTASDGESENESVHVPEGVVVAEGADDVAPMADFDPVDVENDDLSLAEGVEDAEIEDEELELQPVEAPVKVPGNGPVTTRSGRQVKPNRKYFGEEWVNYQCGKDPRQKICASAT
jgi:hypothetical protein